MAALATAVAVVPAAGQQQNDSCFSTAGAGRQFQNWKVKAEQAKKVEFIRTAEKLKTQLATIEKDKNGHLYNRKSDFRVEYSILEELEHKMTVNRKTEKTKILQKLSKIHNNVKRLQRQLKDVKPTPEFFDKFREMMEEVENAINAFKEEQRQMYEQLLKEEKTAINELSIFEKKSIKKWKKKQHQEKEGILKKKEKSEEILRKECFQREEAQKQKAEEERKKQQAAIEAWKKQKAIAFAMEQASQLKLEEEEKKQQKERQRQCHVKLLLERYTLLKKEKEELEKLEKEKREEAEREERKKIAAEEITKFQERDLRKLELKIHEKQAKEEEKREKEKRLAKLRRLKFMQPETHPGCTGLPRAGRNTQKRSDQQVQNCFCIFLIELSQPGDKGYR